MAIKKVMNIITDVIMVSVAAIILPVIGSRLLGLPISTDVNSLLNYVLLGIAAYFVYLAGKKIMEGFGKAAKIGKKMMPKGRKTEKVRIVEREKVAENHDVRYETPNRIVVNRGRPKSEKETFKNYVILEDRQEKPKKGNVESLPDVSPKKRRKR
jgi:hypothetical protein